MKYNYHSHTTYCNHASFSPEALIKYSIKKGFKVLGISEHCYFDDAHAKYRLKANNEYKYVAEINALKTKYQDQIQILCGFECDLISPLHKDWDLVDYVAQKRSIPGVDYLIIGHHFYPSKKHSYGHAPSLKDIDLYVATLEKAFKTNVFSYLAHPDCFINGIGGIKKEAIILTDKITDLLVKYNIPGGININALSEKKLFPSLYFWKEAAKKGVKAILELDCHDEIPFNQDYIDQAQALAKEAGVQVIETLDLK